MAEHVPILRRGVLVALLALLVAGSAQAGSIQFVGNSFTFGHGWDPRSLGEAECSGYELGMSPAQIGALQRVAFEELTAEQLIRGGGKDAAAHGRAVAARCAVPRRFSTQTGGIDRLTGRAGGRYLYVSRSLLRGWVWDAQIPMTWWSGTMCWWVTAPGEWTHRA